jgi:hypothetical protein
MIEGAWFQKPVISSRYPAAEYLDERFGTAAQFFEINSPQSLAAALAQARSAPRDDAALLARRNRVVRDEVLLQRFGERFYDTVVELAAASAAVDVSNQTAKQAYSKAG